MEISRDRVSGAGINCKKGGSEVDSTKWGQDQIAGMHQFRDRVGQNYTSNFMMQTSPSLSVSFSSFCLTSRCLNRIWYEKEILPLK